MCTDTYGNYECVCIDGYADSASGCQEIDVTTVHPFTHTKDDHSCKCNDTLATRVRRSINANQFIFAILM